jgi:uncharacterized membrane protein
MAKTEFFFRWFHVFSGIVWIGHLYFFNFVNLPLQAALDDAGKKAVNPKLMPRALWWFRMGAMSTFLTGLILFGMIFFYTPGIGFGANALFQGMEGGLSDRARWIMWGMLFGSIMWFNVWFVIWPNQKIVIQSATQAATGGQALPNAAAAGARALVASRTNTLFSIPMLFLISAASHLPIAIGETANFAVLAGVLAVILGALELNALKGKTGPLTTIKGVIHCGFALAIALYLVIEFLTK